MCFKNGKTQVENLKLSIKKRQLMI